MNSIWEEELYRLITSIKNEEEAKELLNELLSPAELRHLSERWQIIKLLFQNKPQREIKDELDVAIATVSRAARAIQDSSGALKIHYDRINKGLGNS